MMATNDFYFYVVDRKKHVFSLKYSYGKVFSTLQSTNQLVLTIFNVCVFSSNWPKNRSTITRMTDDKVNTFRKGNYRSVKSKVVIKS